MFLFNNMLVIAANPQTMLLLVVIVLTGTGIVLSFGT
jgi:hypothetical protein